MLSAREASLGECVASEHVEGTCHPAFSLVESVFRRNLTDLGETGAALAVYHRGEKVVDLWGGIAGENRLWRQDTLVMTYSACKPLVALSALILVDRGQLALDRPVADHWPAFAQAGKQDITVRMLLEHGAGLAFFTEHLLPTDLYDWDAYVARHEMATPTLPPGSCAEHVYSYGHLVGELVARVSGQSFESFFAQEVAEPLGCDIHFAVPESALTRCADLSEVAARVRDEKLKTALGKKALLNPNVALDPAVLNSREWRSACVPGLGAHATSDAIARVYAMVAQGGSLDGRRIISEEMAQQLARPGELRKELLAERDQRWHLGFLEILPGCYGLGGLGGSLGFFNANQELSVVYLTRELNGHERAGSVTFAANMAAQRAE